MANFETETFEAFVDRLAVAWGVPQCMRAYQAFLALRLACLDVCTYVASLVEPSRARVPRLAAQLYVTGVREARVRHEHREAARWERVRSDAERMGLVRA